MSNPRCDTCNMGEKLGWIPNKHYTIMCNHPGLRLTYVMPDFYCKDYEPERANRKDKEEK